MHLVQCRNKPCSAIATITVDDFGIHDALDAAGCTCCTLDHHHGGYAAETGTACRPVLLTIVPGPVGIRVGAGATGMTDRNRVASMMNAILDGGAWPAAPTGLHLRLMTAGGSDTANGAEATATACPGYTVGGVTLTFGANANGVSSSSSAPSITATGAWATIAGLEIWDIAATALRWFQGLLTANVSGVSTGDTVQFAAAAITTDASGW